MAYSAFESAFVAILFTKTTSWDGERTRRCTGRDGTARRGHAAASEKMRGPRW